MSWNPHIVRLTDVVRDSQGGIAEWLPGDLGTPEAVVEAVTAAFQPLTWTDSSCALYDGDGYSISLRIPIPPVEYLMLEVWGHGNPVPTILNFCGAHGWDLLDAEAGEVVEAGSSSATGWETYRATQRRSR